MKKAIIWILAVVAALVVVDILFGYVMKRFTQSAASIGGDYRMSDHVLKEDTLENLLVIGSSVALNSLDTKMIEDSLGISAYNAGSNGQNMPYYLAIAETVIDRPGLETIVLGVADNAFTNTGAGSRINFLVPYYKAGYPAIDKCLENRSARDRIMYKSSLYRFNTIWFRILLYQFVEPGVKGKNGFIAKDIPAFFPKKTVVEKDDTLTTERRDEFERLISICKEKNKRLIVCFPPRFEERRLTTSLEKYLQKRAAGGDFELWYDVTASPFSSDSTLFHDSEHINYRGADIYTKMIIERLKKRS